MTTNPPNPPLQGRNLIFRRLLIVPGLLSLLFIFYASTPTSPFSAQTPSLTIPQPGKNIHFSIINAPRYHFEVVAPLLHTLSRQADISRLELVATATSASRFGIQKFLNSSIAPGRELHVREPAAMLDAAWNPDIMLLVSCRGDLAMSAAVRAGVERVLETNPHATMVCMLHEVREWRNRRSRYRPFVENWMKRGRVRFMVLSEHVKIALEREFPKFGLPPPEVLPVWLPVFPPTDEDLMWDPALMRVEKSIGIPGKYEPWRRNYARIFRDIATHNGTLRKHSASLELVGFGAHPGPISPSTADLIHFHDSLDFDQYWHTLRRTLGIATAFATDHYITDQASSTIATAVIIGTPLICGREVLDAYTYLRKEHVWLLHEGEGVVDGFLRVLEMGEGVWARKRRALERHRDWIVHENFRVVEKWLREGDWERKEVWSSSEHVV